MGLGLLQEDPRSTATPGGPWPGLPALHRRSPGRCARIHTIRYGAPPEIAGWMALTSEERGLTSVITYSISSSAEKASADDQLTASGKKSGWSQSRP